MALVRKGRNQPNRVGAKCRCKGKKIDLDNKKKCKKSIKNT